MEPVSVLAEDESLQQTTTDDSADDLVLADLLVEEISIDGMCGVY